MCLGDGSLIAHRTSPRHRTSCAPYYNLTLHDWSHSAEATVHSSPGCAGILPARPLSSAAKSGIEGAVAASLPTLFYPKSEQLRVKCAYKVSLSGLTFAKRTTLRKTGLRMRARRPHTRQPFSPQHGKSPRPVIVGTGMFARALTRQVRRRITVAVGIPTLGARSFVSVAAGMPEQVHAAPRPPGCRRAAACHRTCTKRRQRSAFRGSCRRKNSIDYHRR